MGTLDLRRVKELLPEGESFGDVAIETGTHKGYGTQYLAQNFPRVFTVELSTELYQIARGRLGEGFPGIEFLQGKSVEHLEKLLPNLRAEKAIFFFLDAHWSGDSTVNWQDSKWKGYGIDTAHTGPPGAAPSSREQCPLFEELSAVVAKCRARAHIVIDDMKNIPARGSGLKNQAFCGEDWSHLSRDSLLSLLRPRLEKFVELERPHQWFVVLRALD